MHYPVSPEYNCTFFHFTLQSEKYAIVVERLCNQVFGFAKHPLFPTRESAVRGVIFLPDPNERFLLQMRANEI